MNTGEAIKLLEGILLKDSLRREQQKKGNGGLGAIVDSAGGGGCDGLGYNEPAAIAHAIEVLKASQWRDISSAPKEGKFDLLWSQKRFADCYRDSLDPDQFRHMTHFNQIIVVKNPTHWMPLPPAPKKANQ